MKLRSTPTTPWGEMEGLQEDEILNMLQLRYPNFLYSDGVFRNKSPAGQRVAVQTDKLQDLDWTLSRRDVYAACCGVTITDADVIIRAADEKRSCSPGKPLHLSVPPMEVPLVLDLVTTL